MHTIHLCFNIPDMNCVNLLADVRPLASLMHIQPKFPSCWHSKQFILYISALYSSKNSSCTLNYCGFFSRILMNEIWCLFLPSKRQGADLTWPRLSVFTSMTRTLKTKFRTSTMEDHLHLHFDWYINLPQKFPFVNNLHICFSKINYVL